MNQTVTINISGIVFHIEIDAYENLKNYLNKIKSYFNNSEECEEIMADIEARIAELFNEKISDSNQVILKKDVEEVIVIMGKPEQYIFEDESNNAEKETKYEERVVYGRGKKFFRDPDDRILGGVCSGTAAYLGFDTVWARLFFVLSTLIWGFGPLAYVILWIIIPEAKTASDKLQMRGEPINIDNIGKKVEEEAEKVNERIKSIDSGKLGHSLEQFFIGLGNFFKIIFKGLSKLIGVALLIAGLFLGVWFIIGVFDDSIIFSYTSKGISSVGAGELLELLFSSKDQFTIFLVSVIVVIVIPIVGLILGGIKMLFNINTNSGLGISLAILWFIAIFSGLTLGLKAAAEQKTHEKITKTTYIDNSYSTYVLKADEESIPGDVMFEIDDFSLSLDGDALYCNAIDLTVKESNSDSIELVIVNRSNGKTKKEALNTASSINYSYATKDSIITFNQYWATIKEHRLRGQEVKLILRIPVGKTVYLDESIEDLIYDIDNVTDTWDRDMIGKKWVMLEDGLTCLDCKQIDGIKTSELDSVVFDLNNEAIDD